MANTKNLVSPSSRTPEERKRIAAAAGRASGEAKRRRKAMREVLDDLLQMPLRQGELQNPACLGDLVNAQGKINLMSGKVNVTTEQAILLGQIVLAIGGNTQAAAFVRDTAGQKILRDAADSTSDYEDDGFTEAIKASAKGVWDDEA